MFLGTHHPRLDDKGRLTLPAKFREGLAGGVVLTKGQGPLAGRLAHPRVRRVRGPHPGGLALGRQSPRLLPSVLLHRIRPGTRPAGARHDPACPARVRGLGDDRECVVVGNHDTVEIWNATAWEQYLTSSEPEFADLSEEVVPGLF